MQEPGENRIILHEKKLYIKNLKIWSANGNFWIKIKRKREDKRNQEMFDYGK